MQTKRLLPLSGVAFVALVGLTIGFGGSSPEPHASGAEVVSFYAGDGLRHFVLPFVLAASVPFLVMFAASVAGSASPTGSARRLLWERVLIGGAVLTGAIAFVVAMVHLSLFDGAANGVSPTALQTLNLLEGDAWVAFNAAFGVMMLGAAGCHLAPGGLHRRLGWVALVLSIALFIPIADFVALLLTGVWISVTSVVLLRESGEARHAATRAHGLAA